MLTDKKLKEDKSKLEGQLLNIEEQIALKQQELNNLQTILVRFHGALAYIKDNLKTEEDTK